MKLTKIFLVLALILSSSGCIKDDKKKSGEDLVTVGDKIPAFTVTGNLKTFDSSALSAQVTLITFFHPGCPDCRREHPKLEYVWEQFKADDRFEMVNIGRDLTLKEISEKWPEWLEMPCYPDPAKDIYNRFATATIPRIYLVDDNGIVLKMWVEYLLDDQGKELSGEDFAKIIAGYLRMR